MEYFDKLTALWSSPFLLVSEDGVIVDVNPAGEELLGSDMKPLAGVKLADILEDPPAVIDNYLHACLQGGTSTDRVLNWRSREGQPVSLQCTGALVQHGEDDEPALVVMEFRGSDLSGKPGTTGHESAASSTPSGVHPRREKIPEQTLSRVGETPTTDDLNRQFALNQAISELSQQLIGADENLAKMAELVLAKARVLTMSRRGFVSMIDHKSGDNIVYSPTVNNGNNAVINVTEVENIISAGDSGNYLGVWGEALNNGTSFFNNEVPHKKGRDKEFLGGAVVEKMLAVPVLYSGRVVGLIALANSLRDYNEDDLFAVERLADLYALAINRYSAREKRRELEEQLSQAQKMESIGTLAGGIAHDFNNILGVILGYADMAKSDVPENSRLAGDLDHIIKAGYRARDLVKQILTFSRQRGMELIPLQPSSIIKEAIKMLRSSMPATIRIHQDIDAKCSKIMADPTQIHQIFLNLCTNAYHAMEKTGGDLYVSLKDSNYTGQDFPKELKVKEGPLWELVVRDTGHGIDESLKERIFDPYFTTKEQGKGTGMGLSVIHGIVKGYGGAIKVESEAGQGASFHIYIPAISEEEKTKSERESVPVPGGDERVLLVDDEAFLLDMGTDLLRSLGYSVTPRRSGFEAIEVFRERPDQFDLVVADQTMPGMTGMDLAAQILEIRPELPVIICSGYADEISEREVKRSGVKEVIIKPFGKKDIAYLLRKALQGEAAVQDPG